MLILNRMDLLVVVLFLTQANCHLSIADADEKPEESAVQVVALDDTATLSSRD